MAGGKCATGGVEGSERAGGNDYQVGPVKQTGRLPRQTCSPASRLANGSDARLAGRPASPPAARPAKLVGPARAGRIDRLAAQSRR